MSSNSFCEQKARPSELCLPLKQGVVSLTPTDDTCPIAVELQWLKQAWDHENWFQSKVVPAIQGKFISKLDSRSLKIENKNNNIKT